MSLPIEAVSESAAPVAGGDPVLSFLLTVFCIGLFVYWLRQRSESSGNLFQDALNSPGKGVAIIDSQTRVFFWNQWLESTFGLPASMTIDCRLSDITSFFPDLAIGKTLAELAVRPLGEQSAAVPSFIVKPGSEKAVPVILNFSPFTSARSDKPLFLLTITETSQSTAPGRDVQEALKEAEISVKKMTEVDRLKSEFLAICSHELKTPLVSITGYLDLLISEKFGPVTPKQRNALSICLRNSARLNGIISSLLDFARMEAGKLKFEFTAQRLSTLVDEVMGVVLPMATAKQIKLSQDIPADIPLVFIDAGLMHRVLLNLLDNAIKFTQSQGEIAVKAIHFEGLVMVEVSDNGPGIPPSKVSRITEPFFQGDASDTRKSGGLGLGLAIVEKIISGHSSRLEFETGPDKGTRGRFSLPRAIKSDSGKFIAFSAPPTTAHKPL